LNNNESVRSSRLDIIVRGRIDLYHHTDDNDSTPESDDLQIYDDWAEPEKPAPDA
jgi:hypothetical protein